MAHFRLVIKAIKIDQKMTKFVLVRKENTFEKVKKSYLVYECNQKVYDLGAPSQITSAVDNKNGIDMEDLWEQMKKMQLMVAKLEKRNEYPRCPRDPYWWKCKKTGHHLSQCTERPGNRLSCDYCGRHGNS